MISGPEYVENILTLVHLLTLSLHKVARTSHEFSVGMLNCKVLGDADELWFSLFWLRRVGQGRAVEPCRTSFFWAGLPSAMQKDLRCLKGRRSLINLSEWTSILYARYKRAKAAVEQLLDPMEPSRVVPFEEQVSKALKYVKTSCKDCENGCRGCAAKNVVRKTKDLRQALDDFQYALGVCAEDFAELCENGFDDAEQEPPKEWCACGKRKRETDEEVNEKCKLRRVEEWTDGVLYFSQ